MSLILLSRSASGLLCGLWNGFLVAVLDIQPIIATLILMVSGRGIGLMINLIYGGTNPSFTSPLLQGLSVGHIGLIPTRLDRVRRRFSCCSGSRSGARRSACSSKSVGGNAAAARIGGRQRAADHLRGLSHLGLLLGLRRASSSPPTRTPPIPSSDRPLHRARRDPRGGDRRRFAGGRPHLSRHARCSARWSSRR